MTTDLDKLRHALTTMPEGDRTAFLLARKDGLDYATIAARLDIDVPEVQRRMAAAILHLVRAL
jgi:DNA-directed RNA polymerase specialized sigma24 family protein